MNTMSRGPRLDVTPGSRWTLSSVDDSLKSPGVVSRAPATPEYSFAN